MRTGIWKHYKGGYYQVLGIARHSETNERMVVYVALSGIHMPGPRMCVRPEAMFGELVDEVPRFQYIGDELPAAEREIVRLKPAPLKSSPP